MGLGVLEQKHVSGEVFRVEQDVLPTRGGGLALTQLLCGWVAAAVPRSFPLRNYVQVSAGSRSVGLCGPVLWPSDMGLADHCSCLLWWSVEREGTMV